MHKSALKNHTLQCKSGKQLQIILFFIKIEVPVLSTFLENEVDRGDGKRLEGILVFPFSNAKCICFDATWVDICAWILINNSTNWAED